MERASNYSSRPSFGQPCVTQRWQVTNTLALYQSTLFRYLCWSILFIFFWWPFTFTLYIHLRTNICTFHTLDWKKMLVTAVFESMSWIQLLLKVICCGCLKWNYLNYAVQREIILEYLGFSTLTQLLHFCKIINKSNVSSLTKTKQNKLTFYWSAFQNLYFFLSFFIWHKYPYSTEHEYFCHLRCYHTPLFLSLNVNKPPTRH